MLRVPIQSYGGAIKGILTKYPIASNGFSVVCIVVHNGLVNRLEVGIDPLEPLTGWAVVGIGRVAR